MQLVVTSLILHKRLILKPLLGLEPLLGSVVATHLVLSPVGEPQAAHLLADRHRPRRQNRRPVQYPGQSLERPRVVAHGVLPDGLDHLWHPAQVLGRRRELELLVREHPPREPPEEDLEEARLLAGHEADEGALEQPPAHLADQLRVLRVAHQRAHLAAAHRVAHDEQRRLALPRGQAALHERRDVGDDLRRGTRVAPVGLAGRRAAPASLVPGEHLDALFGHGGEELIVPVDVLAEAVDKHQVGSDGPGWLVRVQSSAARGRETRRPQVGAILLTVHVFVYAFTPPCSSNWPSVVVDILPAYSESAPNQITCSEPTGSTCDGPQHGVVTNQRFSTKSRYVLLGWTVEGSLVGDIVDTRFRNTQGNPFFLGEGGEA